MSFDQSVTAYIRMEEGHGIFYSTAAYDTAKICASLWAPIHKIFTTQSLVGVGRRRSKNCGGGGGGGVGGGGGGGGAKSPVPSR